MQQLQTLPSTFHKNHPEKLITSLPPINIALLIAKPMANFLMKQKQSRPASANKNARKS